MSGHRWMRTVMMLAALGTVQCMMPQEALAKWPWEAKTEKPDPKPVKLEDLMKQPTGWKNRHVRFKARYAMQGNLFKAFNTRFSDDQHVNFAVWPVEARLWDKEERRKLVPTLYIGKGCDELLRIQRCLKRYQAICIEGTVVNDYQGLPWVYVKSIDLVCDGCQELTLEESLLTHVYNGYEMLKKDKFKEAAGHLEYARDKPVPTIFNAEIFEMLGDAYTGTGEHHKAIEAYTTSLSSKPEQAKVLLKLAENYIKVGDGASAVAKAELALHLDPRDPMAHAIMAEGQALAGDPMKAMELAELAVSTPEISPRQMAMAQVHKARVFANTGQYVEAVKAYGKALTGEAGSGMESEPWLRKEVGKLYEDRFDATNLEENLNNAIAQYEAAVVVSNGQDPESLYLQARAEYKRSQDADTVNRVKDLLQKALELDPNYGPAKLMMSTMSVETGDASDAVMMLEELKQVHGETKEIMLGLAIGYDRLGDFAQAYNHYNAVLAQDPNHLRSLHRHAELAEQQDDISGAISSQLALAKVYANDGAPHYNLGRLFLIQNNDDQALSHFELAMEKGGIAGEAAGMALARMREDRGEKEAAVEAYRKVLSINPGNGEASDSLSVLLARPKVRPRSALRPLPTSRTFSAPTDAEVKSVAVKTINAGAVEQSNEQDAGLPMISMPAEDYSTMQGEDGQTNEVLTPAPLLEEAPTTSNKAALPEWAM